MKFIIDKSVYKGVLDKLKKAIKKDDDIFKFIYHEASDNGLKLIASNLNIKIEYTIPLGNYLTIENNGKACILGLKLAELINGYPDDIPISIHTTDEKCYINSMKENRRISHWIPCGNTDEFLLGDFKFSGNKKKMKIGAELFSYIIKHTEFCSAHGDGNIALTNINFEVDNGVLTVAATDEERLSYALINDMNLDGTANFLLPNVWAREIPPLLDSVNELEIICDEHIILFQQSQLKFYCVQMDVKFPNWRTFSNRSYSMSVNADKAEFLLALRNIAVLSPVCRMTFNNENQQLIIGAEPLYGSYEVVGGGEEIIPCEIKSDISLSLVTRTNFINESLNHSSGDRVHIFFDKDPNMPIKVLMDGNFTNLISTLNE